MSESMLNARLNPIVGGAFLPHAPQFFTMPESEDKANVQRVRDVAARIGKALRALKPDVWIVIANDHAEQFFHNVAPPFTIHTGGEATGEFAGHAFRFRIAGEVGFALIKEFYRDGFDPAFSSTAKIDYALGIPMTHLGLTEDDPVITVYVNAYLPPQPSMERCYAFGQSLARGLGALGLRAAIISSGGMSHFPGTDRYANPDRAFDESVLARLATGNLKSLIGYNAETLDDTGNIELRCWALAAGALGERKPDVVQFDPSWHHNYASLGWWSAPSQQPERLHYPAIDAALVHLTDALHGLMHEQAARDDWHADRAAFASRYTLTQAQRDWLIAFDADAMVKAGVHPLVPFLARLQLEREGRLPRK
jgi:2,3-dihydroxyphenylpropionate 1,2-dioxygenase